MRGLNAVVLSVFAGGCWLGCADLDDPPVDPTNPPQFPSGSFDNPCGSECGEDDGDLQAAALAISERCLTIGCLGPDRLTQNEMQILFAAAGEAFELPPRLLKAIAFGEAIATAYNDKWPRHFIDVEAAPGLVHHADWARRLLGVDLPVIMGDDRQFGSETYGVGVMQTTASIWELKKALAEKAKAKEGELECGELRHQWQSDWFKPELTCLALLHGGGAPGYWYDGEVRMDVDLVMRDPYQAIFVGAELIKYKHIIFTHEDKPGGPIPWLPADPDSEPDPDYAWSLLGSTYQTYGGYGPGGGATERIYRRMSGLDEEAWPFVSGAPVLP